MTIFRNKLLKITEAHTALYKYMTMAGIYIHIPFCKTFCNYCDFHSCLTSYGRERILDAMLDEMEQRRDYPGGDKIETIYIGGGTPSICTVSELSMFIRKAHELWDLSRLREVTVESNPDDLSYDYLAGLRGAGFDRLSLGVQSFQDEHLEWMNRRHSAAKAIQAFGDARKAGFDNISIDLIYGMEPMSASQWEYNLRTAVALKPEHISAYHLTVEPGTVFGRRESAGETLLKTEEASIEQFRLMREILGAEGYDHYEVSNFARPGRRSIHNTNYWKGKKYLGIGPSAHSFNGTERSWNIADNARYLELQPAGTHFETETLTLKDLYNEYVMTSLRHDSGVNLNVVRERFGSEKASYFTDNVGRYLKSDLVRENNGVYTIPPEHYFVSDGVISTLFLID